MPRITDWSDVPLTLDAQDMARVMVCSKATIYRKIKEGKLQPISTVSGPRFSKRYVMDLFGCRPRDAAPEVDPEVVYHLEQAQFHHNEAMRILELGC